MKEGELVNQPTAPAPGWGSECWSLTKATSPQTVTCRMGGSGGRPARWAGPRRQAGPSRGRGINRAPPHPAVGHNVGLGRAGRGLRGRGRRAGRGGDGGRGGAGGGVAAAGGQRHSGRPLPPSARRHRPAVVPGSRPAKPPSANA